MNSTQYTHISKTLSHALRHSPDAYDLTLDSQGWCSLSDLVFALNSRGLNVDESIIEKMIESSIKKRHEILNGKIRALYGHSVENKIVKNAAEPPEYLFHGTVQSRLGSIMEKGLLPMNRQYVHLSSDEKTAEIVGRRRKGILVILKIRAKDASLSGIKFYSEENGVWLSNEISSKYIVLNGVNRD